MKKMLNVMGCIVLVTSMFFAVSCNKSQSASTSGSGSAAKQEPVTLTLMVGRSQNHKGIQAISDLAEKEIGVKIEMEIGPTGADWDNMVKTRIASNSLPDLLVYNSGSLLSPLDPASNFVDLTNEPLASRLDATFKSSVTVNNAVYGVPLGETFAGGVMYNKKVYEKLGLSVPHTWKDFLANCDKVKAAGLTAIIGSYKDTYSAQVLFLGDNFNVCSEDPTFPQRYYAGTAKFSNTPAALKSWQKMADTVSYYNKDLLAATVADGAEMLASGEAAHFIMLTRNVLNQLTDYRENINDIGVFGVPGDDPNNHGLTIWMPNAVYGNKKSDKIEAIKKFLNFYVSDAALNAYCNSLDAMLGPILVPGFVATGNRVAILDDMESYINAGKVDSALEFKAPLKGSNCEQICIEVLTGQASGPEGAKLYDEDVYKMAVQLGLNWK